MIKKRNLHPSLINWLHTLNLGPAPGDIKFCCRDNSSGSRNYKTWLQEMGVDGDDLYVGTTSPATAYAACTAGQGDTLVVMPGWYNLGATGLVMNKRDTHVVGAGQVPQIGLYGSPTVMYNSVTTTSNGYTVLMSAEQNSLRNVTVSAYGNHANQKSAVKITQSNMYLKGLTCFNFGGSTIAGTANACDLWIDTSVPGGSASVFEDCIIGNSGTTTRTSTSSAVILFGTTGGGGGGQNVFFKNSYILSKAETVGIPMVHLAADYTVDRLLLFDNCVFYNFWTNHVDKINYAIDDDCGSTHDIILKDCALAGVDAWANSGTHIFTNKANAESDGGKVIAVDTTP